MSEPFLSGDCRQRADGARRQCSNKHDSRFRVQGFGDHGADVHVTLKRLRPSMLGNRVMLPRLATTETLVH